MPKGQQNNITKERTAFIKQELTKRLHLRYAAERISELKKALELLKSPVRYSADVLISLDDCNPSTGRYKQALPKNYMQKLKQLESVIQMLEAAAISTTYLGPFHANTRNIFFPHAPERALAEFPREEFAPKLELSTCEPVQPIKQKSKPITPKFEPEETLDLVDTDETEELIRNLEQHFRVM